MHRIFQSLIGALLLLQTALCMAAPLPNIVVFIMDDVGQTDVGAFGNPEVSTPNIDQLAAEGMRFHQAFLTTSSCSSSRASILTGLYPHSTGAPALHDPLPGNIENLPRLLKAAGYYTASIGKWHLGEPFKQNFDRVVDMHEPSGAADWLPELARKPKDKPFFFWLASLDAHVPYDWTPPLRHHDPRHVMIQPWYTDTPYERVQLAEYYDEIERADSNIGKVVNALRQSGELDNTLIIVLSDNGASFGSAKTSIYDEGLLTPLIMRYPPRIAAQGHNQQLVSSVDLAPTLLELAGVPLPVGLHGVSLWPTIADPQKAVRPFIYAERNKHVDRNYFERAIRTKEFLYKQNYDGRRLCDPEADLLTERKPRDSGNSEFYHLPTDPAAQHDISSDPEFRSDQTALRQQMNQIMYNTHDKPPPLIMEQCKPRGWEVRVPLPKNWLP